MVMANLNVNICGIDFKNPVIPASGVFGYGREYEELFHVCLVCICDW